MKPSAWDGNRPHGMPGSEGCWPVVHMHLGDFQTDAYASSLSWQESWEFKDSCREFMLLWKLNPSWKQHKRAPIKDATFCLLLESVTWPPASWLPFIKALVTFFVNGWFSLSWALQGLFYFQQWFPFHLNLLSVAKDVLLLYSESAISRGGKKYCLKPIWGHFNKKVVDKWQ